MNSHIYISATAHHPELPQDIKQLEFQLRKLYFVNSSFSDCHSQITVTALLFILHFLLLSPSCFGRASQIRENSSTLSSFHLFLVISFLFCSLPFRISNFGSISIIVSFIYIFQEKHQRFNFIFLDKRLSSPSEASSTSSSSLCTSCDTNPSVHFISINENNKNFWPHRYFVVYLKIAFYASGEVLLLTSDAKNAHLTMKIRCNSKGMPIFLK